MLFHLTLPFITTLRHDLYCGQLTASRVGYTAFDSMPRAAYRRFPIDDAAPMILDVPHARCYYRPGFIFAAIAAILWANATHADYFECGAHLLLQA